MPYGSPAAFPSDATIGAVRLLFRALEPDDDAVTDRNDMEDGGATFLVRNDTAPLSWELLWDGLSVAQADVITAHYLDARKAFPFTFNRDGVNISDGRYTTYERTHSKTWVQRVRVVITQFP